MYPGAGISFFLADKCRNRKNKRPEMAKLLKAVEITATVTSCRDEEGLELGDGGGGGVGGGVGGGGGGGGGGLT